MRLLFFALLAAALAAAEPAELPPPVARALDAMVVELPADVGYTMEIERGSVRSTERFDPAQPVGSRWTLLARDNRPPTSDELAAYTQYRSTDTGPGYRASFRPEQVDRAAPEIVSESPTHVSVRLRFTEAATEADKLLGQLDLVLLVQKEPAAIASYRLQLRAPYSPVLGVRIHALDAGAELDEAGRPRRTWSRFEGRIFLRQVNERIEARYRDYISTPADGAIR